MSAEAERINALIREVPDWPKPGVVFKDITPLLSDAEGFTMAVDELTKLAPQPIDIELTYVKVGGDWKLSGDAVTTLAGMGGNRGGH